MPKRKYNHNRRSRRDRLQKLRDVGYTKIEGKYMIDRLSTKTRNPISCWEGEKVKLDFERLANYKDYEKLSDRYKEFIENNRSAVFTVEFDPYRKEHNTKDKENLVQLVEDTSNPKWLFWAGDLIPLPGQKRPLTTKELFLEKVDAVIDTIVQKETEGNPELAQKIKEREEDRKKKQQDYIKQKEAEKQARKANKGKRKNRKIIHEEKE